MTRPLLVLAVLVVSGCGQDGATDDPDPRPWPTELPANPEDGSHLDLEPDAFYEGWYHKVTLPDRDESFFFIYSVINPNPETTLPSEAFLYCGRGSDLTDVYQPFPVRAYSAAAGHRDVRIGDARATALRFAGSAEADGHTCAWDVDLDGGVAWTGTMGQLTDMAGLETSWTVGTMRARASGWIVVDGERYEFTDGIGYGDHNWGTIFPREWVWMQANAFPGSDAALAASGGTVPYGGTEMQASMIGLYLDGEVIPFRTQDLDVTTSEAALGRWRLTGERLAGTARITVEATCDEATLFHLLVPTPAGMRPHAWESLRGTVDVTLETRDDPADDWTVAFQGASPHAGVELGE